MNDMGYESHLRFQATVYDYLVVCSLTYSIQTEGSRKRFSVAD